MATIDFEYIVTADTKEEALALLTEALGPDWAWDLSLDDIEHPQIEEGTVGTDISCLGPKLVDESSEASS
jgi:hypothetical protein